MPLNLYLIKREEGAVGHDEVCSAVVAAPTAAMARRTAREIPEGAQSPEVWAPGNAALTKIGTAAPRVKPGVVHMDFKNG